MDHGSSCSQTICKVGGLFPGADKKVLRNHTTLLFCFLISTNHYTEKTDFYLQMFLLNLSTGAEAKLYMQCGFGQNNLQ